MSGLFGAHPLAGRFNELDPMQVLDAVEIDGQRATGRFQILNSYENRVYQLELEGGRWVVGKFYRPGRWSLDALDDEHEFLFDLDEADVPVSLPLALTADDDTLGTLRGAAEGIHYALFDRVAGRAPAELSDVQLRTLGELLADLHSVGEAGDAEHRPTLSPATYGRANLAVLQSTGALPPEVAPAYVATVDALLERIEPLFEGVPIHRIHGDCHLGNLMWTPDGPVFLDFDDMLVGPAVQDVWMLVPSFDAEGDRQRRVLLEAYTDQRDFDPAWLQLVEPLRALRFIHYSTWIARRIDDPTFKRTFGHFGTLRYWQREVDDLREQIARIDQQRWG